ncbi:MAG: hypothetical protein JTT11_07225, partial [Candidatus Brockarchaeota archaeon]|nr:hypothetical protein [Candidatus Brockarchaeota archaeon]
MGDVFEGGLYLYGNDSITVIPPPGYRADYVSPKPDAFGGSITWHGPRNFPSGEPAAEFLSMETKLYVEFGNREAAEGEEVVVLGRIEPPLAVPVVITYTKPDGATFNQVVTATSAGSFATKVLVDEAGVWHVQATWSGNAEYLGSASQKAPLEVRRSSNFFWLVQYALPPAAALAAIVLFAR